MPNFRYQAGTRFEREVKKRYEKEGWTCFRTAGSHGCADVICAKPGHLVYLVQCKRVATTAQARKIIKNMKEHPFIETGEHYSRRVEIYVTSTRERIGAFV